MTRTTKLRAPMALCALLLAGALGGCPAGDKAHDDHDGSAHDEGAAHDEHDHSDHADDEE